MADSPPDRRRSFWHQARTLLALGWRQKLNMFSRPKAAAPGVRTATALKTDRKILLPILFGGLMLLASFSMCYQAVHGLARHADRHWPPAMGDEDVIELGYMGHWLLEQYPQWNEGVPDEGGEKEPQKGILSLSEKGLVQHLQENRGVDAAAARAEADRILAHYEKHGMEGFVREGLHSQPLMH